LSVAGCAVLPEPARQASWLKHPFAPGAAMDSQIVQLEVALLERPVGDAFLTQELWQHTDQMVVALDRRTAVEDNGFRVGQIVGMTPGKLQELLKSERYCINPRLRLLPSGHSVLQYLGPVLPRTDFAVQLGRETVNAAFDQARFCLDVKATLTQDGKTRLAFTPKIETGETALPFQPDPDRQAWVLRVERPCRTFPELSWEVSLAAGELLVIGALLTKENALGYRSFVQEDGRAVQRVLVVRTRRAPASDAGEPTLEDIARSQRSPCLALQASMSAVRASGE
jgi:hypothetical protein